MQTNEIVNKTIEAIGLNIDDLLEIYRLVDYKIDTDSIGKWSLSPDDDNFLLCSYEDLGNFLDGLIILKRGASADEKRANETVELTNNLILKKLRIALNLKEHDIEIIFALGEISLTKQQLSSLFRKETHRNFKVCSDELLMAFLDGLCEFYYATE